TDTITMQNEIHEYFNRKTSDWGIRSFLDESGIEPFDKSIDAYIKSLNNIIASEQQGKRSEKAQMLEETKWRDRDLLGSYHSRLLAEPQNRCEDRRSRFLLTQHWSIGAQEPRNDYKLARKWAMRKLAKDNSVYFYNPTMTVTGNSNSVVSNNGTFNSISKRDKKDV
ncbi:14500_t:CDS:2, partial [Gigaspora rosea]